MTDDTAPAKQHTVDLMGSGITVRQYSRWRQQVGLSDLPVAWPGEDQDFYMAYARFYTDEERLLFKLRFGI